MEQVNQATGEVTDGREKLYAALVEAQAAGKAVAKNSENSHHHYKYASAEAVIEEARAALGTAKLALFPVSWEPVAGDGGARRIAVHYRLVHGSGQCLDLTSSTPVIPDRGRPEDKAELSALTANLSYTLRGLLLLPRDADADSVDGRNDTGHDPQPQQQRQQQPPDKGSQQLIEQYVGEIRAFGARFDAATDDGERFKVMRELEQLPPAILKLNIPVEPITDVYNPIIEKMRERLGIATPGKQAAE